ncbi:MAG: hypothetical protein E6R03_04335 [Hyphomicrobiaceae bacterium]|nr:MAG: hypothetical protein E6R03_04335 [Hyphomicrobiaceae bacterium]
MSFNLELGPVPGGFPGPTQLWLEQLRQRLNFMVLQLNTLGCGLYFDADGNLAVKHDDSTIVCDATTGLEVDPAAVDHGLLAGLGDDDHPHYLKEKASGGAASEIPVHAHTGASEAGTLDHGAALTGLGDDDHTQYIALKPATAARNTIKPSADVVPLTLQHYSATPSANLLELQTSAGSVLVKIGSDGKATVVDADTGFTDPNSHLQASNGSVNALLEEIAYVVKEQTVRWPHVPFSSRWLDGATYTYSGGADMFGGRVTDGSTQTIAYFQCKIPQWYQKSGSNVYTMSLDYFVSASPGADQVWVLEIKHRTFDQGDSGFGSYTTTTTNVNIASGATASAPRRVTVDVTSGDFGTGDEMVHFAIRRNGAAGADTYTGDVYVMGITVVSGIKST